MGKHSRASTLPTISQPIKITSDKPFADKTLPTGEKLYKREHGIEATVSNAMVEMSFVIPYNICKITGLELIAAELGDKVNFKVYDTPTGTISGVPNLLLNQFGFDVFVAKGYHLKDSKYDADLIKDMKITVEYTPKDMGERQVYCNLVLHEVKP